MPVDPHDFLQEISALFEPVGNRPAPENPTAALEQAFIAFQSNALLFRIRFPRVQVRNSLSPRKAIRKRKVAIPPKRELAYLEHLAAAKVHSDRRVLQPEYERIMSEVRESLSSTS
ncbi:hypothetical protein HDU98_003574 [Podochytrium sp. JEL0797]|nr:hypothetical protein HDU98_003574 [Podochytrium sp. JEL0797]